MKVISCITAIALLLLVSTGCRAISSSIQEKNNSQFSDTLSVEGVELKLHADMIRLVRDNNKKVDLSGTITVTAVDGLMPQGLDLYHIALRPSKGGYYVQNYRRNEDHAWNYPAPNRATRSFHAQLQRRPDAFVLNFNLRTSTSLFNKAADYDRMDVTISLKDAQEQRHALSVLAQPVRLEQQEASNLN